jgi:hypothetical protein
MERETTKHGPRLDEALKKETASLERGAPIESRVEEDREVEGPGEEGRDVDVRPGRPGDLGGDDVEARRELSRHLRASVFPAGRDALLREAESQQAPASVLSALGRLPAGPTYGTVHEVWAALSGYEDVREAAATDPLSEGER